MKLLQSQKLAFFLLFLIIFSSCKKAGEEVIETVGKTIAKETIETSVETGTKAVIKSLTKKEIEYAVIENGFNKAILKNVLNNLSNHEASLFVNESKFFKSNILKFNNNPDLVIAYKKIINSESHRTNLIYLNQAENWIKNGSKGELILNVQSSNVEKKLLGTVKNDIPYIKKNIHFEGLNLSAIVPDFSKYRAFRAPSLESVFFKSPDKVQFEICRANLRKEYLKNPKKIEEILMIQNRRFAENGGIISEGRNIIDPLEMLEKQKNDILQKNSGKQQGRIFGFVWHHNEEVGIIDLVAYDKHNTINHIGGRNIWGGGSIARKIKK
ncbi:colicin-lik bacteriocin with DNase/tRNase domain [Flavobacterium limicola]|uniref:Colicin-lik bacteriocin with DNase/tRNase domain n=1 Tax=Flavobacterium limicola TaxID=180441 RepID=A0A495S2G5_9FLAO|nr:HNH endonuclease [Flavobacterium limicola]RKS93850.1 colicin-lik bacteriocin with DNase/tRNase domain [Flavobacterium limicola]